MQQHIVAHINNLQLPVWALLLSINVVLLIMGSFLEPPAAILILTPLLLPLVQAEGVDLIHFGIIMAVNRSIGMYPPAFRTQPVRLAGGVPDAARHDLPRHASLPGNQLPDPIAHHVRAKNIDGTARQARA